MKRKKIDLRRAPDGCIVDVERRGSALPRLSRFDGIPRPSEHESLLALVKSTSEEEIILMRSFVKELPESDAQQALDQLLAKLQAWKELHTYRQAKLL